MPSVAAQRLRLDPRDPALRELIRAAAPDEESTRSLVPRVLLHLPRLAGADAMLEPAAAEAEAVRLAASEAPVPQWMRAPADLPLRATDLELRELGDDRARFVLERVHYLRSHRDGLHFAGMHGDRVAALLTFSSLDLPAVGATLPVGVEPANVLVLARVYAVSWAPRNTLSRLISLASSELRRRRREARLIFTYLNPNVGFDGASYRAANWILWGREAGTRYAYLDKDYVTDRELTGRFGTSEASALIERLGARIAFSRMPLVPLELYALPLDRRLRPRIEARPPSEWLRPWR